MDNDGSERARNSAQSSEGLPRFRFKSPFLTTQQAGAYVGLSGRTLEKMRCNGGGPEYRKHGRYVRYHIDALDAWSASHSQQSTAET
ncbi:MAG: helix-turn-helix domain-containing protein [Rhizomicrobium sp.]